MEMRKLIGRIILNIREKSVIFLVFALLIGLMPLQSNAVAGVPELLSYQGRLTDTSGNLLGGSGTDYCFRFSIWDAAAAGSQLWPAGTPGENSIEVKNGVFNAFIGTADTLDYDFQTNDNVYLNVALDEKTGGACGDDEVFSNLAPRQRIVSSGFSINSDTVDGFHASQTPAADEIPVLDGTGGLTLPGDLTFGGALSLVEYADFDTSLFAPAYAEGRVFYDTITDSLAFYNAESGIQMNIGSTIWGKVKNDSGALLPKGSVVRVTGTDGFGNVTVDLAKADSFATAQAAGILTKDIADGDTGYMTVVGAIFNLDTSTLTEGDTIYLSDTTAGGITSTKPSYPGYAMPLGVVAISNATFGVLGLNISLFTAGAYTPGGVTFGAADGLEAIDATNFLWDDTNNRLGIGTNTPSKTLSVGTNKFLVDGGDGSVTMDGDLTLVGGGTIISTSGGTLTLDSVGILALGATNATSVSLGRTGVTTTNNGALTVSEALTANGVSTFNTDTNLTFAGTENLGITSDLAGTVNVISLIATPSASAGTTGGLFIQQVNSANANGLDSAITIDNADTNLAVPSALTITNTGGGGYTNLIDTPSFDVSGTGVISGATGFTSTGGAGSFTLSNAAFFSCGKLNTDGAGNILCGVDATGGAGGSMQDAYDNGSTITTSGTDINITLNSGDDFNIIQGTGSNAVNINPGAASSFTSGAALTLTGGAASTWGTTVGNLTLQVAGTGTSANVHIGVGGAGSTTPDVLVLDVKSDAGDPSGVDGAMYYNTDSNKFRCYGNGSWSDCDTTGGTTTLQSAYNNGATITTGSSTDIALTLTSGNFTAAGAGSVNLTPSGASSFTSGGALTFTAGAASTWKTSSGALTVDSATILNLGTNDATALAIGKTATTTTINGEVAISNYINFNNSVNPAYSEGSVFYDNDDNALAYRNDTSGITLQIGQEEWIRVKNTSGSPISDGEVVYTTGAADDGSGVFVPTVSLAKADSILTSDAIGLATHVIANGAIGYVTHFGLVHDIDTSAFSAGDTIYLSESTAGAFTTIRPSQPNLTVILGHIVRSNATLGSVAVTNGTRRSGSFTAGTISFGDSNGELISDITNLLFWDDTNNRLGIGTSSPSKTLSVGSNKFTVDGSSGDIATEGDLNLNNGGGSITSTGGALTITAAAASTWSTSAGALTVDSAAALNLGTTNATSVSLGRTGVTTTNNGALTISEALTANGTFTLGDNGDTGSVNTSDWDISTAGNLSGIGTIGLDGTVTQTGATGIITGTLGIDYTDSDTNPSCAAGEYKIYADTSEAKLKKCTNGTVTDLDTGGTSKFVVKATDEGITSSTTLQNDDELAFAVGASETWIFHFVLLATSNNLNTQDFKAAILGASGWTCSVLLYGDEGVDTAFVASTPTTTDCDNAPTQVDNDNLTDDNGVPFQIELQGWITTTSAGTVTLQWAPFNSVATAFEILGGSYVVAQRVGGSDLAEMYYTKDSSISPADVVSVDGTIAAGVKKSTKIYDSEVMGIITTKPGLILGDGVTNQNDVPVMVALSGRVPVNVTDENGPIKPGDYLTSSSKPGFAMKATKAGTVIGQALTNLQSGEGKVLTFIKNTYYNGESDEVFTDKQKTSGDILTTLASRATQINTDSTSNISTDKLIAGLEIITPKITASEATISNLNVNSFSVGPELARTVTIDIDGNALFAGTVTVNKLIAKEIESPSLLSLIDRASAVEEKITLIENTDTQVNSMLENLTANYDDIAIQIQTLNSLTPQLPNSLVLEGLTVSGLTKLGDVEFGRPYFTTNTAGFAKITVGADKVEVTFDREYIEQPIVSANITLNDDNDDDINNDQVLAKSVLAKGYTYIVGKKSEKGFTIYLNKAAEEDVTFSWIALAVKNAKEFTSITDNNAVPVDEVITVNAEQVIAPVLESAVEAAPADTTTAPVVEPVSADTVTPDPVVIEPVAAEPAPEPIVETAPVETAPVIEPGPVPETVAEPAPESAPAEEPAPVQESTAAPETQASSTESGSGI